MFQDYLLFPHLSSVENVAFGLRAKGTDKKTARAKATEAPALMGDRVRVRIEGTPSITAEVPPAAVDALKLDDGGELWASVNPDAITVYPP
jgi:TOBE domain